MLDRVCLVEAAVPVKRASEKVRGQSVDIWQKSKSPRQPPKRSEGSKPSDSEPHLNGGSAREPNPPTQLVSRHNGPILPTISSNPLVQKFQQ